MVVDTQQSLLTYLFNLLVADDTLKAAMGGSVRLYPVWAKEDAVFPYLVHRIDNNAAGGIFPLVQATYYLDIWSNTSTNVEALAIRKRIIELLDEKEFSTTDAEETIEVCGARLWLQSDGFVPETEPDIWHYAFQFNLRFYRSSETDAIVGR